MRELRGRERGDGARGVARSLLTCPPSSPEVSEYDVGAGPSVGVLRRHIGARLGLLQRVGAVEVQGRRRVLVERAALAVGLLDRGAGVRAVAVADPVAEVGEPRPDRCLAATAHVVVHPVQEPVAEVGAAQRRRVEVELTGRRLAVRVTPRLPHHPRRGALGAQRLEGRHRLLQVEQRVALALHEQRRDLDLLHVRRDRGMPRELSVPSLG